MRYECIDGIENTYVIIKLDQEDIDKMGKGCLSEERTDEREVENTDSE